MYLRFGGVVNNQVKKGLLLSLPVKKIIIGEHLSKLQARTRLSPAICSSFSCVVARRTKCNWKYESPQAQRRTWSKRIKNIWRSDVRTCSSKDDRGQTNTQTDTLITTGPILRNDNIESQESTKYLSTQGNAYAQKDRPTQDTHFNYRQKLALN